MKSEKILCKIRRSFKKTTNSKPWPCKISKPDKRDYAFKYYCRIKYGMLIFKKRFNFNSSKVITVGIGEDFDYNWNFENDPPQNLPKDFDLIISQAMFEHLLNPYKHLSDLTKRLQSGVVIIVHTFMLGFAYHRYPIDAFRFFPDWFEAASERLNPSITRKLQRDFNIFYVLKKRYGK